MILHKYSINICFELRMIYSYGYCISMALGPFHSFHPLKSHLFGYGVQFDNFFIRNDAITIEPRSEF